MPDLATIIDLTVQYGPWGIPAFIIWYLLRVILDEDRSSAWRARVYKAVYEVSGKTRAEKKYVENDINSRINLARRKMPFGKEYLPKAIKVEWFEGGKGETEHIRENEIVVRLDPAESQEKNVMLLANALVKQTALVGIRHILNEPLEFSLDLNLVRNLLEQTRKRRILDWFLRNEYQPTIDQSREIREWNSKVVEIDQRGLFTRLLLVELDDFSKKTVGRPSSRKMLDEITGLIEFLYKIATKVYGQDVPLNYTSRNIRIGIVLVGETSKILWAGVEPYLKAFAYNMQRQLTVIYVVRFDKELLGVTDRQAYEEFVELTERLNREIEERFRIRKDFELTYACTDFSGNKRKATVVRYVPEYVS